MSAPSDNPPRRGRHVAPAPLWDWEDAGPGDRDGGTAVALGDGDTPPRGVPPVVVPRNLGAPDRNADDGSSSAQGGQRHRRGGSRHRRRMRLNRRGRLLLLGVGALVLVVVGLVAWVQAESSSSGRPGAPVLVHVRSGESVSAVMATLTRDGVIGSSLAFQLWSVLHGQPTPRPGLYQLRRNLSFATASAQLTAGPNVFALTIQPGTTVAEIANQLSQLPGNLAQAFVNDARTGRVPSPYQQPGGRSLEGLIGAGTYQITPGESAKALLGAMVARFDAEAKSVGLSPGTTANGVSAYGVITVASIAMKEGYFSQYFGKVSRVVYNRLANGMTLDMTSTVLYSLGQDGGTVTPAEEQVTTPYNTYLRPGLTPTPICTPSVAALRAAAAPPAGTWLYFELTTAKKGVMVFSASYTTQLAAEQQAAQNAAASPSAQTGAGAGS